jgi:regulator of RNase E activity RraA
VRGSIRSRVGRPRRAVGSRDELAPLVEKLTSASIVDAMGRLHRHRCHILDLVSPDPERHLFGPAATILFFPSCSAALDPDRYSFGRLFYEAVGEQPAGKVLVLASNGHPDASVGGGTKLSRVHNHGLAGVITDARLRDFDELRRFDFAAYCQGEATRWGGDLVTPFQANVPVVIDRVGIMPGQYVYADSAGAVIIPEPQVREVLETALTIESDDARFIDQIRAENPEAVIRGDGAGET